MSTNEDESRIITTEELEIKLKSQLLHYDYIQVIDLSDGCGSKFEIEIISNDFIGKSLLMQHRLVNKIIQEEREYIHAITLKTKIPSITNTNTNNNTSGNI